MSFPFSAICLLQAIMFFVLTIVKRKYSDHVGKFIDKYCAYGIVKEEINKVDTEESDDWVHLTNSYI